MELSNVSVAVLAGGFGTRLRSVVADRPKVLAQIRSQPFLTICWIRSPQRAVDLWYCAPGT